MAQSPTAYEAACSCLSQGPLFQSISLVFDLVRDQNKLALLHHNPQLAQYFHAGRLLSLEVLQLSLLVQAPPQLDCHLEVLDEGCVLLANSTKPVEDRMCGLIDRLPFEQDTQVAIVHCQSLGTYLSADSGQRWLVVYSAMHVSLC